MVSENYSFFNKSLTGKAVYPDGGRSINFYSSHGMIQPYTNSTAWTVKTPISIVFIKNNVCSLYFVTKDGHEFTDALEKEIKKPFLEKVGKRIQKIKEQTITKLKSTDFKKLSDKQLIAFTKEYFENYHSLLELPASCRIIDQGIRKALLENIIHKVAIPIEPISVTKEELEVLLLADKVKKKTISQSNLTKEIKHIYDKYCFNSCGYFNERAKTIQEYENTITNKSRGNPKKDYETFNEKFNDAQTERKKVLKTLSSKEQKIANIAALAVILKDQGKEAYNEIIFNSEGLFQEISKRTNKTTFFIKQLYPEEVQSVLLGNIIPEQDILKRVQRSAEIVVGNKVALLLGNEVDLIEKEFFPVAAQKELKGRVASTGNATGKACVIISEDNFDDFQKGDVLVVQNTNPWHVVIMKKASAIIAEEGGLTSHVAVTSRELGIPCIVGVLNATKIIKSGDTISIDAIKGLIKIQ